MSQRFRLSLGMAILFATVCGTAIARPPHGQGSLPANLPSVDQVFQRFDANQDGQLEQNEMPAAVRERFFRADGNRDGFVTKAELQDARRRFAQKEQGPRGQYEQRGPQEQPGRASERLVPQIRGGQGIQFLKDEIREARTEFVESVARITGLSESKVWEWMPTLEKPLDPNFRILVAIERELGRRLSADARDQIIAADKKKHDRINRARATTRNNAKPAAQFPFHQSPTGPSSKPRPPAATPDLRFGLPVVPL